MIAVLDANALRKDPLCSGAAWMVLAHMAKRWGLAVNVSELSVAEAVAVYHGDVTGPGRALRGLDALGLKTLRTETADRLEKAADEYPRKLREQLTSLDVTVITVAPFPHMDVAARAIAQRRPFRPNGDGYRDTLHWLTVVDLARRNSAEDIVWVTDDRIFLDEGGQTLHPQLVEELREAGVAERVRWAGSVGDLVLGLFRQHTAGEVEHLGAAQEQALRTSVQAFLDDVLDSAAADALDPRACGMPVGTVRAHLIRVGSCRDLELALRGALGNDGTGTTAAEFMVRADCVLEAAYPTVSVGGPEVTVTAAEKELVFRGLVTLDRFQRPVEIDVSRVEAPTGDPGVAAWVAADRRTAGGFAIAGMSGAKGAQDWLKAYDAAAAGFVAKAAQDWLKTYDAAGSVTDAAQHLLKTYDAGTVGSVAKAAQDWLKTYEAAAAGSVAKAAQDWLKTYDAAAAGSVTKAAQDWLKAYEAAAAGSVARAAQDWLKTYGSVAGPARRPGMGTSGESQKRKRNPTAGTSAPKAKSKGRANDAARERRAPADAPTDEEDDGPQGQ